MLRGHGLERSASTSTGLAILLFEKSDPVLVVTSIDEVLILLLALLAGYPLRLAAVQILWINLVTESTLTVNLVMDPPDGDEMKRPPVSPKDRLVDTAMLWRIAA